MNIELEYMDGRKEKVTDVADCVLQGDALILKDRFRKNDVGVSLHNLRTWRTVD